MLDLFTQRFELRIKKFLRHRHASTVDHQHVMWMVNVRALGERIGSQQFFMGANGLQRAHGQTGLDRTLDIDDGA